MTINTTAHRRQRCSPLTLHISLNTMKLKTYKTQSQRLRLKLYISPLTTKHKSASYSPQTPHIPSTLKPTSRYSSGAWAQPSTLRSPPSKRPTSQTHTPSPSTSTSQTHTSSKMTNSTTTVTFSAPEQYQRAIDAYALLNGLKRSEACRHLPRLRPTQRSIPLHPPLRKRSLQSTQAPAQINLR
jgi:hypothetical protein